ncbi:MAG: tripartite tricarboxylate transporter substrate binding protein [Burkholderiales bacterium]|nr:tripartite tricarboxylate transporter substrate binding protein [Burkholderiales bacterium]
MAFARGYAVIVLATLAAGSHAQPYPNRPLRIIVPYPPGASTDYTARLIGQRLGDAFGQPVVVENRAGAGGIIAADLAAHALADGYTLFFGTPAALCISPAMQRKVPYDTRRDFAPVARLVLNPQILVAAPGFAANTVAELVALARLRPGQLSYASAGLGSPQHLGIELLKARAGIDLVHVPYKGGALAMTDLLGGRVQMHMGSIPGMVPLVRGGKIKVLGVAAAERSNVFPEVATVAEALPGYEYIGTWYGILTQSKVPRDIVERLNGAINAALKGDELRKLLIAQGSNPQPMTVEEFTRFVHADCPNWARAVKVAGLRPE